MTRATTALPRKWSIQKISSLAGLILGILLLLDFLVYSVILGTTKISRNKILESLITFDGSYEDLVVKTVILPRSLLECRVVADPVVGTPMCVLIGRKARKSC
ncbi:hypothetical protein LC613_34700 [Nostoc sphaeroides CHAB 2801]|uniref:hypothetical protein n=1 Tax=Nostoc sphaeroides TaxID=446679 RepID=UPI001E406073|nr:hypothetical protein [Nostoc sphaeroides]MCC5632738.1 hypothetical protein [Nostoc sphaeroides CHAB 2801]